VATPSVISTEKELRRKWDKMTDFTDNIVNFAIVSYIFFYLETYSNILVQ